MQAAVRLEHTLLAVERDHDVHGLLELAVPEPAHPAERQPLRLALVVDRSGSMTGPKLEVAKRCADWLVARLRADDELAVVAYDDRVDLVAPLGRAGAAHRQAVAALYPGGSTNLSGGWLLGLEQLRAAPADGVRKVLLLTDGLANVGVTDTSALVALARQAREDGIGTTTIGFGDDFDEDLLIAMADAGGGSGHYAATPDAAPGIFVSELEGLASVVAQNLSVEIRPSAAVEVVGVLNEYPTVETAHGLRVGLGDAYGGERARIVFELHVPHLAALGPARVADVVVRYVSVGEEIAEHTVALPVVANVVSADEAARALPDAVVREEMLVLRAARARDEAARLADVGEHDAAAARLRAVAGELRAAGLDGEATALDALRPSVQAEAYGPRSRKHLHYESLRRRRRRSGS